MARRHVYTSYPTRRIVALGSHCSLAYYSFLAREWAELPLLFFIDAIWSNHRMHASSYTFRDAFCDAFRDAYLVAFRVIFSHHHIHKTFRVTVHVARSRHYCICFMFLYY